MHIMTGYSRDALGESCVLNFTHSQHGGFVFISLPIWQHLKSANRPRKAPLFGKAVREAKKNGAIAGHIARQDIIALLGENLEEARERLNIKPPKLYQQVHAEMQANGIDPYEVIGQVAA